MDLWDAGALGMVEARGLAASIVAVDVMAKAAEVTVIGVQRIGDGLVAVSFTGDMASVTTAVESARQAVAAVGGTITSTVIGRPAVPTTVLRDTDHEVPAGVPPAGDTPGGRTAVGEAPAAATPAASTPAGDEPGGKTGDAPAGEPAGPAVPEAAVPRTPRSRSARSTSPKRGTPGAAAAEPPPASGPPPRASGPPSPAGEPPPEPPTRRPRGR
ncbi:BMC domain-containing protein [Micromonospora sp. NPDC023956]|uniref:BMC domain-containing protein n=1 Tax=Micromonospora sp. NPDC023956 TaxID=3155722 RepID=UPI0033CDE1CA